MVRRKEKKMNNDELFMKRAIALAMASRELGNEPFGAVLVKDNQIVMEGNNNIHTLTDPTHHAEIGLIRDFCQAHHITDLSPYTLYSSCEPCVMCSGAMVWSKLGRLVYSVSHDQLAQIAGFNIMIGSEEVFEKSPFAPKTTQLMNKEGLAVFENYVFK